MYLPFLLGTATLSNKSQTTQIVGKFQYVEDDTRQLDGWTLGFLQPDASMN